MEKIESFKSVLQTWIKEYLGRVNSSYWMYRETESKCVVKLYTSENVYKIVATNSYLGCTTSSRKTLPEEDHHRGKDLSDGKFNYYTFCKILGDIIANELVFVGKAHSYNDQITYPEHPKYDVKFESKDKSIPFEIQDGMINNVEITPHVKTPEEIKTDYVKNIKLGDLMSEYDIYVKIWKYTPEQAMKLVENNKRKKLEKLKLQILRDNPSILGTPVREGENNGNH